jgi:hypothetical protein
VLLKPNLKQQNLDIEVATRDWRAKNATAADEREIFRRRTDLRQATPRND